MSDLIYVFGIDIKNYNDIPNMCVTNVFCYSKWKTMANYRINEHGKRTSYQGEQNMAAIGINI